MLEAAGFNIDAVKQSLRAHSGDVLKAIDELLASGGIPQLSDGSGPSRAIRDVQAKQKELEAYERLTQVIPTTDDDHLDLSLEQEELFLFQYKSLLKPD